MLGVIVYLMVLGVIKAVVAARGIPIFLDSPESFAFVVMVPLTTTCMYFLAVFTFGLDGDLAARRSMYPSRRLTLPVTTNALTVWPMVFGGAAMITLWLALRTLALWPSGVELPSIWPAFLGGWRLA